VTGFEAEGLFTTLDMTCLGTGLLTIFGAALGTDFAACGRPFRVLPFCGAGLGDDFATGFFPANLSTGRGMTRAAVGLKGGRLGALLFMAFVTGLRTNFGAVFGTDFAAGRFPGVGGRALRFCATALGDDLAPGFWTALPAGRGRTRAGVDLGGRPGTLLFKGRLLAVGGKALGERPLDVTGFNDDLTTGF
jgi:hypothetical protein